MRENAFVDVDNEKELMGCFKDDTGFEHFKTGLDYSKRLATEKTPIITHTIAGWWRSGALSGHLYNTVARCRVE